MGAIDYGSQRLTVDYNEAGKTEKVNLINYDIVQKGIYSGGVLTKTGANELTLSPLVAQVEDRDYSSSTGIGVRVETTTSVVINSSSTPYVLSSTNCYIVARMVWINTASNYMDILAVGYNSVPANHTDATIFWDSDIIIGKAVYISGVLQSDIDYTDRDKPIRLIEQENKEAFKVTPHISSSIVTDQVDVSAGTAFINGVLTTFAGATSDAFSTTTGARTDLLCLDKTGSLVNIEGVNGAGVPAIPKDIVVLALITRISGRSVIEGTEIIPFEYTRQDNKNDPVGLIHMFDGTNWVDNITMRGWYACISANVGYGCPNLVDSFVMGRDPSVSASIGGANSIILSTSQLPTHSHSINHNHSGSIQSGGAHSHLVYTEDSGGGGGYMAERDHNDGGGYTLPTDTHAGHVHGLVLNAYSGSSGSVGNGSSIDKRPKYYTVIFVRKCV